MFENIPKNWKKYKLKDLYYILRGGSPRPIDKYLTSDPNGINWIKIGDAKVGSKFIESTKEKIIPEGKNKSRFVNVGDFILSNSMSFGRPYIMKTEGCIHDGWLVLKEKEKNIIYKDFVYYLLCSKQVHSQFENAAAGGVVSNLNIQRVENVEVVIPNDIREQKEIADVLDAASEIIRLRTACIESAQSLIPALFQEMFGDINNNIHSLPISEIKSCVEINPTKIIMNDNDDVTFLGMKDVTENGQMDLSTIKKYEEVKKGFTSFKNDDVLLAKITPCFENGKAAIAKNLVNNTGFGSTEFYVLRPEQNKILPEYLYSIVKSSRFLEIGKSNMKGAAGQKRLIKDFVSNYKFLLPDMPQQELFATKAQEIEAYIKIQQAELENAKNMFQSILYYAFTGKLTKNITFEVKNE